MSRCVCVIPARMGSSRFPGKPMKLLLGLPLILHVYDRCRLFAEFDAVIVATCDEEIYDAVIGHGGTAVMTADSHERCTDRVEEAIGQLSPLLDDNNLVVMVQGDEVLVSPDMLNAVVADYRTSRADVINLISRLYRVEDHDDPNTVKAVADPDGNALYFSRAPIPSRARAGNVPMYQQTGIIAFRAAFLGSFAKLPQTPLEIIESVDMMRVIEHQLPIRVVRTDVETIGVDTPSDLARAEGILRDDPLTQRYLDL